MDIFLCDLPVPKYKPSTKKTDSLVCKSKDEGGVQAVQRERVVRGGGAHGLLHLVADAARRARPQPARAADAAAQTR